MRRAAAKAIKELALTTELIGAEAELQSMAEQLEPLASAHSNPEQAHIEQAYENVAVHAEQPRSIFPDNLQAVFTRQESTDTDNS